MPNQKPDQNIDREPQQDAPQSRPDHLPGKQQMQPPRQPQQPQTDRTDRTDRDRMGRTDRDDRDDT